jgi:hypothetical protein
MDTSPGKSGEGGKGSGRWNDQLETLEIIAIETVVAGDQAIALQ